MAVWAGNAVGVVDSAAILDILVKCVRKRVYLVSVLNTDFENVKRVGKSGNNHSSKSRAD